MTRRHKRRRKYKYHRNQFDKKKNAEALQCDNPGRNVEVVERQSASAKKVRLENITDVNCGESTISGYRVVSMDVFANVLQLLGCNSCSEQHIYITEDFSKRKGCSSLLHVRCASCGWQHSFYTSLKINNYYEVNR